MIYIYDILLNFNTEFFEFYEWEKSDLLFHIKKIPIYKVETKVIEDFLTKKVIIDSPLLLEIYNDFISSSHNFEEASLGIRQSPRGERVTLPTFGPSGRHERLNCCEKKRR